jgi:putative phosphoribosyl transferase
MMQRYSDRRAAGQQLALLLEEYSGREDTLVLGLPRGGVPVAFEIADSLHLPLDVFIVRKLGAPGQPELALGAIASGGLCVLNDNLIDELDVTPEVMAEITAHESAELARRETRYRGGRPELNLANKNIILVDDGIATGATMRAAIKALRYLNPTTIIMAVPVAEKKMLDKMAMIADRVVCPLQPTDFRAVGWHYEHFEQTTDDEVNHLLAESMAPPQEDKAE